MSMAKRIRELIRPASKEPDETEDRAPKEAVRTMTIDLAIAAAGFALFGACVSSQGDLLWHAFVGAKVAAAFLAAFLLSLSPLFAIKRFYEVEETFANLVGAFARLMALGGIFAASAAGFFWLLRKNDPMFDGPLAIGFVVSIVIAALVVRRGTVRLPAFPRALAVVLFLGLLGQSAWAFRPYMDPAGPTLFEAQAGWFEGDGRRLLEGAIVRAAGVDARRSP
jgi:hypothetical protein